MMPLMAGVAAASPISRYPAGGSSGTLKPADPSVITAMASPGFADLAHRDAGPAGSCSTTSIANSPVSGDISDIV